mgnify:CR=1 FL=1
MCLCGRSVKSGPKSGDTASSLLPTPRQRASTRRPASVYSKKSASFVYLTSQKGKSLVFCPTQSTSCVCIWSCTQLRRFPWSAAAAPSGMQHSSNTSANRLTGGPSQSPSGPEEWGSSPNLWRGTWELGCNPDLQALAPKGLARLHWRLWPL